VKYLCRREFMNNIVEARIEIPMGSQNKYEVKKSDVNYRPRWWNEYILNAFEKFRGHLWNEYKIKSRMSREEFILWTLKFGKIIKDENLWQEFIPWLLNKDISEKRSSKETIQENKETSNNYPTGNHHENNLYQQIPKNLKTKLENDDISQDLIESFFYELLEKNNILVSEEQIKSTCPLLLFHEKEWYHILKLITYWLKESEYKVMKINK